MTRKFYLVEVLSSNEAESHGPFHDEDTRDTEAKRLAQNAGKASICDIMDHTILWASVEDGELQVGTYLYDEMDEWFHDGTYVDLLINSETP